MSSILEFLNQAAFSIGGTPTSIAEILGFVLGIATVYLVARANIWTFPIGILQCVFFFVLFYDAKLFADMWLQVFFIVVQAFGWWAWLKAGPNRSKLVIRSMPKHYWGLVVGALVVFVVLMVPVLREAHGSYPVADSSSTGLSVMAQFLLSFKVIENWFLWIAADLIYIPLYFAKDLYFTSGLYIIFLCICIGGYRHWKKLKPVSSNNLIDNPSFETSTTAWGKTTNGI